MPPRNSSASPIGCAGASGSNSVTSGSGDASASRQRSTRHSEWSPRPWARDRRFRSDDESGITAGHPPCVTHGHDGPSAVTDGFPDRSEEHTSELQSRPHLVCRLLLEKKKKK